MFPASNLQSLPSHGDTEVYENGTLHAAADDEPARKRPRVSQACGACRHRKTRCDGRKPICRACDSRGIGGTCDYTRVRRRRTQHPLTPTSSRHDRPSVEDVPTFQARRTDTSQTEEPTDGLVTLAGRDDNAVYGPSSTVAFLRHVLSGPAHETATPSGRSHETPSTGPRARPQMPERIPQRNDAVAVLPRRRSADDFLSCYWEFIHPMFPVLHKGTFIREYEAFWYAESTGQDGASLATEGENVILLSTMNLVFALGCKFSDLVPAAQKNSVSGDFYQKSRQLFVFDILDSASLPLIQMLILTGVYLQSTQHAGRCWNAIGLAIRVAQGLGLHLEPSGRKAASQVEREMRRRIWWTCVNLDRLLAMTFGRPTMVRKADSANSVSLPAMIDDEYLGDQDEGVQPPAVPSQLGLFVSSCTLFELLEEVLSFLSEHEPAARLQSQVEVATDRAELVMHVLDLNRRLDQFSAAVPAYLKVTVQVNLPASDGNQVKLQQQVLYCRFLLTRLLLLRPLLLLATSMKEPSLSVQTLDGAGQSQLESEVIRRCCELCIQTACRLVDTLYANLGTLYRSSGWHAVYFTFSAAIVLLASLKCDVNVQADDTTFETCWTNCLAILEHYKDQVHTAAQAIRSLKTVRHHITQKTHAADTDDTPTYSNQANSALALLSDAAAHSHQQDINWTVPGVENFDQFSLDGLSDSCFGPHLANLDWLEFFQL